MTEESPILTNIEEGIYWITLNRPDKLNGMTLEMHDMICDALDEAEKDDSARCVVITGAGDRAFCAGADISQFPTLTADDARAFAEKGHRTTKKIMGHPKPVVAAVNGYALGGGCELAIACDLRVASEKARFGQPEINLGLIPGWGATQLLPRLLGKARAFEMITTGRMVGAEEAKEAGLVNKVAELENFTEEIKTYVQGLVAGPGVALMKVKGLLNTLPSLEEGLAREAGAFGSLFTTEDMKEGVAAFQEKRKPIFKGK